MSRWDWDYEAFGELLCGPEMQGLMGEIVARHADVARAIAPEYTGHYRDSFKTEVRVEQTNEGRRAVGHSINTADYAASVEYGNKTFQAHHVMVRALDLT